MRYTIGLATTFHDSALAIVGPDGDVLFAEATERYLQLKRAPHCAADQSARMTELVHDYLQPGAEVVIATSWGPQFTEFLARRGAVGQFGVDAIAKLSGELNRSMVPKVCEDAFAASLHLAQQHAGLGVLLGLHRAFGGTNATLRRYPHHLTHAAYACFGSPFDEAVCLVVDGMGETGASAIYRYADGRVHELVRHRGRESIGFYFGLITDLCGFDQSKGEEWKVMGLAPYGSRDPGLMEQLHRLYRVEGGRIVFSDEQTVRDVVRRIDACRPQGAEAKAWADLARCGQDVFEDMMQVLLAEAEAKGGSKNLVLSGGCALNSSFNGKILDRASFTALHVPSAPADDGNALGAAWLGHAEDHPDWRPSKGPMTPYLGTPIDADTLPRMAQWEPRLKHVGDGIVNETARLLAAGKLVGWVQGRAEFGPRALGNRSILADPRPANAKDLINLKVKLREPFRPFAPSILEEHGPDWFESFQRSPYMDRTLRFRADKRGLVPAVVHVDGTGRLQTVTNEMSPRYRALIETFHALTGVPIVLNTSFNIMGKPIVHSVTDALMMFYTTGLDAVVIDDWLIVKS
jgi:carbamoyltransferase